jgi:hypothetical protein
MIRQHLVLLPSEMDIAVSPILALLTTLDVTLEMVATAMTCEHPNLDEIDHYLMDKLSPDVALVLAQAIIDKAASLCQDIVRYKTFMLNELSRDSTIDPSGLGLRKADYPF